jgi:hypothetical protein
MFALILNLSGDVSPFISGLPPTTLRAVPGPRFIVYAKVNKAVDV